MSAWHKVIFKAFMPLECSVTDRKLLSERFCAGMGIGWGWGEATVNTLLMQHGNGRELESR